MARTWWRFDAYEIRGGLLRPTSGARCAEYEPWAQYLQARATDRPRPYEALLGLVRQSVVTDQRGLLRWVQEHGLLGLGTHRAEQITVPSRLGVRRYTKLPSGRWATSEDRPADAARDQGYGVVFQDPETHTDQMRPLEEAWAPYFPSSSKARFEYPPPLSADFWRQYAEPVEEFIATANMLRTCIESLGRLRDVGPFIGFTQSVPAAIHNLEVLSRGTRPVLECGEDQRRVTRTWDSPSLLGWLARMVEEDLLAPDRVLTCAVCGTLFRSALRRAAYCSLRCRTTGEKRRQRQMPPPEHKPHHRRPSR